MGEKEMKKKLVSGLLAIAMTAGLLSGCGSSSSESNAVDTKTTVEKTTAESSSSAGTTDSAQSSEPITLSVWAPFTGSDGDVLREIMDDYNKTNNDGITIKLDIMDNATLQSKLPTAVSTGTGPSFVLVGIEYLKQYAANGLIEDISDFWDKTGVDKENYYKNVVAKSYVGDTQYGVPMQYNLQYLYYNKDIFKSAGLDPDSPPTTLDELRKDAIACTDASKNQYGLGLPTDSTYFVQYLWANGGDVINEDGTENSLNSEQNATTLQWLQDLELVDGVSPKGLQAADADTMFQAGQLGMYISGPWNINGLNQLGMNYGITAIPAGTDGAYSPEGGCAYMLTKGADDATKAAVYKFMAYWLSDDVLKKWSTVNGFPVWSYSVLKDPDVTSNEILSDVSAASNIGRDWHLGLEIGSEIDSDVMVPMIESILAGNDVKTELKTYSDKLDSIITK